MLPCHNFWDLEEQRGRGSLNLSYGEKRKSHKQEELLWNAKKTLPKELTTELLNLELPTISVSCGVKRYMHYIRFLLTKNSYYEFVLCEFKTHYEFKTHLPMLCLKQSLNQFFVLDLFLFTLLIFYQSANDN